VSLLLLPFGESQARGGAAESPLQPSHRPCGVTSGDRKGVRPEAQGRWKRRRRSGPLQQTEFSGWKALRVRRITSPFARRRVRRPCSGLGESPSKEANPSIHCRVRGRTAFTLKRLPLHGPRSARHEVSERSWVGAKPPLRAIVVRGCLDSARERAVSRRPLTRSTLDSVGIRAALLTQGCAKRYRRPSLPDT